MKKRIFVSVALLTMAVTTVVTAKHFWRGEIMSKKEVQNRWGNTEFNGERFKGGDEKVRASMAHSLLEKQKEFVGKSRTAVRSELGDHDGFYFSDMFPAYIIESATKEKKDTWQLVFILDREEKVAEIIVHKNCCD